MISYITNINDNIRIFCERGDICGCRALCLIESYGAYGNIIDFWVQYIDDRIVSVIVKYGADMTVVTSDDTDKNELRDFIYATGAKSIVFDRPFYNAEIVGKVMELKEPAENKIPAGCRIEKDVPLNEAYDLIKEFLPKEEGLQKRVAESMNYSFNSGGKRLRPMFMMESYRLFKGEDFTS